MKDVDLAIEQGEELGVPDVGEPGGAAGPEARRYSGDAHSRILSRHR